MNYPNPERSKVLAWLSTTLETIGIIKSVWLQRMGSTRLHSMSVHLQAGRSSRCVVSLSLKKMRGGSSHVLITFRYVGVRRLWGCIPNQHILGQAVRIISLAWQLSSRFKLQNDDQVCSEVKSTLIFPWMEWKCGILVSVIESSDDVSTFSVFPLNWMQ